MGIFDCFAPGCNGGTGRGERNKKAGVSEIILVRNQRLDFPSFLCAFNAFASQTLMQPTLAPTV